MWTPFRSKGIDRSSTVDATIGTERRDRTRELRGIRQSRAHGNGPWARLNLFLGHIKRLAVAEDLMIRVWISANLWTEASEAIKDWCRKHPQWQFRGWLNQSRVFGKTGGIPCIAKQMERGWGCCTTDFFFLSGSQSRISGNRWAADTGTSTSNTVCVGCRLILRHNPSIRPALGADDGFPRMCTIYKSRCTWFPPP